MTKSITCCLLLVFILFSCKNKEKSSKTKNSDSPAANISDDAKGAHQVDQNKLLLAIDLGPCNGTCPIYKMHIYQNGYATYEGIHFVDSIGHYESEIDKKILEDLKTKIKESQFFDLKDEYVNKGIADLPTTIITVQQGNKKKTITAQYNIPNALSTLKKYINELALEKINWQKKK